MSSSVFGLPFCGDLGFTGIGFVAKKEKKKKKSSGIVVILGILIVRPEIG